MLTLENVTFNYGDKTVIHELSHIFAEGEISALTGVSGSGKTTLLYLLSGLYKPTQGKVINEHKMTAVVFQEPRLFPWMTAIENVTVTGASKETAFKLLSQLFPNEDISSKYPDELSGGMKQRLSIARAIAPCPDLLLLDEPFKGLDSNTRAITAQTVFTVMKNKTCILITHDDADLEYCDNHLNIVDIPITHLELVKTNTRKTE